MNAPAAVIMTTVKDRTDAAEMANHLIQRRVAACIQEVAIQSHYNWNGKTNCDPEILLLVKTTGDRVDAAVAAIREKHKYEVPEILVTPVAQGLEAYLHWVKDETRPSQ